MAPAGGEKHHRLPNRMPISKLASKTPSNMEGHSWVCCHRRQSQWIPGFQTWSLRHCDIRDSTEKTLNRLKFGKPITSRYYNQAMLRFWNMLSQIPGWDTHLAFPCLGFISGWRKHGAPKGPRRLLILNSEVKDPSSVFFHYQTASRQRRNLGLSSSISNSSKLWLLKSSDVIRSLLDSCIRLTKVTKISWYGQPNSKLSMVDKPSESGALLLDLLH